MKSNPGTVRIAHRSVHHRITDVSRLAQLARFGSACWKGGSPQGTPQPNTQLFTPAAGHQDEHDSPAPGGDLRSRARPLPGPSAPTSPALPERQAYSPSPVQTSHYMRLAPAAGFAGTSPRPRESQTPDQPGARGPRAAPTRARLMEQAGEPCARKASRPCPAAKSSDP